MSKLGQMWRRLFHNHDAGHGRYKAIVNEKFELNSNSYKTCVFARNQDDIVPNVERRMRKSYAKNIEITDVFYQASGSACFENAHLSQATQQDIDKFNKNRSAQNSNRDYLMEREP